MNRSLKTGARAGAALAIALGVAACGAPTEEPRVSASLETRGEREARINVTPALDISALYDARIADRLEIDEIVIGLADARLLGADPRIPAGGFGLLDAPQLVEAFGGDEAGLELPFPEHFLTEQELAVYVRIDRSVALEGSSVVVRGRIYANPSGAGVSSLIAGGEDDGEGGEGGEESKVAKKTSPGTTLDPDGEPAYCAPTPATLDPDGEPARCKSHGLVAGGRSGKSVPIELRGGDVADLVAGLDASSTLDVIIGIPADRWLTPETMEAIDHQLSDEPERGDGVTEDRSRNDPFVVKARSDRTEAGRQRMENGEYFLSDDPSLGRLKVRRE